MMDIKDSEQPNIMFLLAFFYYYCCYQYAKFKVSKNWKLRNAIFVAYINNLFLVLLDEMLMFVLSDGNYDNSSYGGHRTYCALKGF